MLPRACRAGLIAGIFLLGFGLVAVPKQLWKCADLHGELRRLEHQAGGQAERTIEAHRWAGLSSQARGDPSLRMPGGAAGLAVAGGQSQWAAQKRSGATVGWRRWGGINSVAGRQIQ